MYFIGGYVVINLNRYRFNFSFSEYRTLHFMISHIKLIGLSVAALLASGISASATDVSIQQLGSSAVAIQPSNEARKINSPKTQDLGDVSPAEQSGGNSNPTPDYQHNVLNNNYMTAYGRVKTTTENENNNGPMEVNEPNTVPVTPENTTVEKKAANDTLLQQEKKYNQARAKYHPSIAESPVSSSQAPETQEQP